MSRKFQSPMRHAPPVHPLLPEAVALHQAGRLSEADLLYEKIIAQTPKNFDAVHLHGVIALQQERYDVAEKLIKAALAINPKDAAALTNLGTAYLRCDRFEAARSQFERALHSQPNSADALLNLGTALRQLSRPREAIVPLRRAYKLNAGSEAVCNLLGACLLDTGASDEAVSVFEAATRADPNLADSWANLAVALTNIGDAARAADCAQKAIALQPESSTAVAALAAVHLQENRIEEAITAYWEAVDLPNPSNQTRCAFAIALLKQDMFDDALEQLRLAMVSDGNNLMVRWLLAIAQCRPTFDTAADVSVARLAFADQLTDLENWFKEAPRPDAYLAVGSYQPFYLAYQHFNNRELLNRYGRLCAQAMASVSALNGGATTKRSDHDTSRPSGGRKLRVGIASAHIRNHSVWIALTKGLVRHLDRSQFDLHVFQLDPKSDSETAWAKQSVEHFEDQHKSLAAWVGAIRAAKLDVLIFPEIGMDPMTTQLAAMRLVPVQAAVWGHPETTGLPTMDVYFSAARFETGQSQDNYSERLICLPNLGACVEPLAPTLSIPDLPALGVSGKEPLLLCPGTPFKYSPVHDPLWARLAKRLRADSGGRLVFFLGVPNEIHQRLVLRLRKAFRDERLDFDKEVYLLPFLARPKFFSLMQQSALMLDTLGFSGFNTALQGIEAGLPVLAREGEFMRGKLASGILRQLELPELVATSDEAFVDMAVQLTADTERRKRLSAEIVARRHVLFNDLEPIRAFERHLLDLVG